MKIPKSTKAKVLSVFGVASLLAALFAPGYVGVLAVVERAVDRSDCAGLCGEGVE